MYNQNNNMDKIAEKIIELGLFARKVTKIGKGNDSILPLKEKLLYLLYKKSMHPFEICESLCISKTNLAHLTSSMEKQDLLSKINIEEDKRQIKYLITDKGAALIDSLIETIEDRFKNILISEQDYLNAKRALDEVLELFSFV